MVTMGAKRARLSLQSGPAGTAESLAACETVDSKSDHGELDDAAKSAYISRSAQFSRYMIIKMKF
jgi:hypothetical protein